MKDQTLVDPRSSATVRHLREAAVARVENSSLRGVAREIGMSPMGLRNFLHGTEPYAPTLRRLRNWYVKYAAVRSGNVHTEDAYEMCCRLAREEGVLAGFSSGAALQGAFETALDTRDAVVVTILCDGGERYLDSQFWEEMINYFEKYWQTHDPLESPGSHKS